MTISTSTVLSSATRPVSLLYFDAPWSVRLCNRSEIIDGATTWTHGNFIIRGFDQNGSGIAAISIDVDDSDYVFSELILQLDEQITVSLYRAYFLDNGSMESELIFTGHVVQAAVSKNVVSISASGIGARFLYTPRLAWDHAEALGRGSKVIIGETTYVFE